MDDNRQDNSYQLDFDPLALARIRISKYGPRRVFDSQRTDKLVCGLHLKNQHGDRPLLTGKLKLDVTFYIRIKRTNKKSKPNAPHCYAPDLDNMLKFICDIMTNTIISDDKLIYDIHCVKLWSRVGKTIFTITEVK